MRRMCAPIAVLQLLAGFACGGPLSSQPDAGVRETAESGGSSEEVLQLPIPAGVQTQCVQGAGGAYSHHGRSTQYDLDLDTSNTRDELVVSPIAGRVYRHLDPSDPFGIHLNIDLGNGLYVVLGHFKEVFVRDRQRVVAGTILGYEGCTGNCTGDHIHVGVHRGDPSLSALQGESVKANYVVGIRAGVANMPAESMRCGLPSGEFYRSMNAIALAHPNGSLVKSPSDARVYRIDNGSKRWIQAMSFSTYGYDFKDVITVSENELSCYRDGADISQEGMVEAVFDEAGALWLLVGSHNRSDRFRQRVPAQDWSKTLRSWGLAHYDEGDRPSMAQADSVLMTDWPVRQGTAKFRDGTLVKEAYAPEIYVVSDGMALHVKDMETLLLLGYDESRVIEVSPGAVAEVMGAAVGSCQSGLACLDKTFAVTCGGVLSVGGDVNLSPPSEPGYEPPPSRDAPPHDAQMPDAPDQADDPAPDPDPEPAPNPPTMDDPDPEPDPAVEPAPEPDPDPVADPAPDPDPEPVVEPDPPAQRVLHVEWRTPFGHSASRISLSGEYIVANGTFGFVWSDREEVHNDSRISYEIAGVEAGDRFRFSVEFVDASGQVSWSCIGPYISGTSQRGTLQGTVTASVDGVSVAVSAADDPTSLGCGLILTIP